jgi:hypothetical protein
MIDALRSKRQVVGWVVGFLVLLVWFFWSLFSWEPLLRGFWATALSGPRLWVALAAFASPLVGFYRANAFDPASYAAQHTIPSDRYCLLTTEQFDAINSMGYLLQE